MGLAKPPTAEEPPRTPRNRFEGFWWNLQDWFHGRKPKNSLQIKLQRIIFGTDTFAGRTFDLLLLAAIVLSVLIFMLESVERYYAAAPLLFKTAEWVFTIAFTIEYALRLYSAQSPAHYMKSFYGVVDLLSTLPLYIELIFPGMHFLLALRLLRLLRIFRILKLFHFIRERDRLLRALRASFHRIAYFLFLMVILTSVIGTIMFLVESSDPQSSFVSIPKSIYWSIVTLTTVGYGDISPVTNFGQVLASIIMLLGYAIIAVPTGIVTAELTRGRREKTKPPTLTKKCKTCGSEKHATHAKFCDKCGTSLDF